MYLRQFLAEDLKEISPSVLYKEYPNISIPELKVNELRYDQLLAIADQAKYDLLTVVNSTKNDQMAYHSVGDLAMEQIITERIFGIDTNSNSWTSIFIICTTVILSVSVAYLFFKLNTLTTMIILSQSTRLGIQALSIQDNIVLEYRTSTQMPPNTNIYSLLDFKNDIVSILPVEIIILIAIMCLLLIAVGYAVHRIYRKSHIRSQTTCLLQVGNSTKHVNIPWTKMIYPPEFYGVQIKPSHNSNVKVMIHNENWPISKARIQIVNQEIKVTNASLAMTSMMKLKNEISFFTARKTINIIQEPHFVALVMLDVHNAIKSCTMLRSMDQEEISSLPELEKMPSLETSN